MVVATRDRAHYDADMEMALLVGRAYWVAAMEQATQCREAEEERDRGRRDLDCSDTGISRSARCGARDGSLTVLVPPVTSNGG